jgi:hypothetical protein
MVGPDVMVGPDGPFLASLREILPGYYNLNRNVLTLHSVVIAFQF